MEDRELERIDQQIRELEERRAARERELADPERQEVVRAYAELERALDRLDDLGESITTEGGYNVSLFGRLFNYSHGDGITENKNPAKRRKKR